MRQKKVVTGILALFVSAGLAAPQAAHALRAVEVRQTGAGLEELESRLRQGEAPAARAAAGLEEAEEGLRRLGGYPVYRRRGKTYSFTSEWFGRAMVVEDMFKDVFGRAAADNEEELSVFTGWLLIEEPELVTGPGRILPDDIWRIRKRLETLAGPNAVFPLFVFDHNRAVMKVAFSPDGNRVLARGMNGTARLWDAATGEEVAWLERDRPVRGVAFSPDGSRVLTGSKDGTARLWDAATGKEVKRFKHDDEVRGVAFSPEDGKWVLTGSKDGTAWLWNAATGEEVKRFKHDRPVTGVAFSPKDGKWVLTTESTDGIVRTARLWNAATGEEVAQFKLDGFIKEFAFSPDGSRVLTVTDRTARLWDAATGKEVARLKHNRPVTGVAFSPDGKWVLTGSWDHIARIWDAATGKRVKRLEHYYAVTGVAFSPDGNRVLTESTDGAASLWNAETGEKVAWLRHDSPITDPRPITEVAFSPDGSRMLTGGMDGTARLWDAATGEEVARLEHGDEVRGVAFSPDGSRMLTGSWDFTVRLWALSTAGLEEAGWADWIAAAREILADALEPLYEPLHSREAADQAGIVEPREWVWPGIGKRWIPLSLKEALRALGGAETALRAGDSDAAQQLLSRVVSELEKMTSTPSLTETNRERQRGLLQKIRSIWPWLRGMADELEKSRLPSVLELGDLDRSVLTHLLERVLARFQPTPPMAMDTAIDLVNLLEERYQDQGRSGRSARSDRLTPHFQYLLRDGEAPMTDPEQWRHARISTPDRFVERIKEEMERAVGAGQDLVFVFQKQRETHQPIFHVEGIRITAGFGHPEDSSAGLEQPIRAGYFLRVDRELIDQTEQAGEVPFGVIMGAIEALVDSLGPGRVQKQIPTLRLEGLGAEGFWSFILPDRVAPSEQMSIGFEHVVDNAVEAMVERAREETGWEGGEILTELRRDGSGLVIEVADSGIGIGKEDLENRLFRESYTTKEAGGGYGTRLHYGLDLVRELNGRLEVESRRLGSERAWKLLYDPQADEQFRVASSGRAETGTTFRWVFPDPAAGLEEAGDAWSDRFVEVEIPVETAMDHLREIREMRESLRWELEPGQLFDEEDLSEEIIKGYGDALEEFNAVILNGPMNAERLREKFLRFHQTLGRKVVTRAGRYDEEKGQELRQVFEGLFSPDGNRKISEDPVGVAAGTFARLVNLQGFADGNKRAASLIMNYILMKAGYAPFLLTEDNVVEYARLVRVPDEAEEFQVDAEAFRKFLEARVTRSSGLEEGRASYGKALKKLHSVLREVNRRHRELGANGTAVYNGAKKRKDDLEAALRHLNDLEVRSEQYGELSQRFNADVREAIGWAETQLEKFSAAGLEEGGAARQAAGAVWEAMKRAAPPLRWVVIGRSVAERLPALAALAWLEERFLVDEGPETVVRLIERGAKAVVYYGKPEEGRQFSAMAERALISVKTRLPTAPAFLAQLREILALAGIPEGALAAGLEEFAGYLESVAVGT